MIISRTTATIMKIVEEEPLLFELPLFVLELTFELFPFELFFLFLLENGTLITY